MARNEHTPDEFEAVATELAKAIETLNATVALMRETGMPTALVHGSAPKNLYLPAVLDWIEKTSADVKMQARSYLTGVQSQAELHKLKSDSQKRAAAKGRAKKIDKKKTD